MSGWPRILTVGVIVLFFVVGFFGLVLGNGLSKDPNAPRPDQCELLATKSDPGAAVLEPQNTWSNFAYLVAGALILYRSRTLLGAFVGLNLAFEFLFSSLYHGKLTFGLQKMDVALIYVLLLSLAAYAIQSLFFAEWSEKTAYPTLTWPVFIALVVSAVVIIMGVIMGVIMDSIFESTWTTGALVGVVGILLIIGLGAAALRGGHAGAIVVIIVQILAVGIPTLWFKFSDGQGKHFLFFPNLCCPKAPLQSHSSWHILSAVMVAIAYDFFANFSGDGRVFSLSRPAREFVSMKQAFDATPQD
jgi:hypothetical protein